MSKHRESECLLRLVSPHSFKKAWTIFMMGEVWPRGTLFSMFGSTTGSGWRSSLTPNISSSLVGVAKNRSTSYLPPLLASLIRLSISPSRLSHLRFTSLTNPPNCFLLQIPSNYSLNLFIIDTESLFMKSQTRKALALGASNHIGSVCLSSYSLTILSTNTQSIVYIACCPLQFHPFFAYRTNQTCKEQLLLSPDQYFRRI